MLPQVIPEKQIFGFEFWFDGAIHQGMHYQGELFCRLGTYDLKEQSRVYHLGIRLTQKGAFIILSCAQDTCSLWGNLRASVVKEFLTTPAALKDLTLKAVAVDNRLDGGVDG